MRILLIAFLAIFSVAYAATNDEIVASEFIKKLNADFALQFNLNTVAEWNYDINITDANSKALSESNAKYAVYNNEAAKNASMFDWQNFKSADLRRQFKRMTFIGESALSAEKYQYFLGNISAMETHYSTVTVCDYKNPQKCDLALDPEIEDIIGSSRDPEELKYYWKEFYDKAGTPTRKNFENYVELANEAARLNNLTSYAEFWLKDYEDETFEAQVEAIFETLKPFYDQLHAYVRYKLNLKYGDGIVNKTGPIPMHILGNIWGAEWRLIGDVLIPFPNKSSIDVTAEMVKQGITPKKLFEMADDFFTSMGLIKLPPAFWEKSVLEKPTDGRDIVCSPSAWDFYLKDDVRISMCATVTQQDLAVAHHECGHLQYYLQYQNLPFIYRNGANVGFQEAVGDVLGISVLTAKHLQSIGLLQNHVEDEETRLNNLFLTALEKIAFIPYAYSLDKWRWAVFRGEISKDNMNCAFWKIRNDITGIEPPVVRTEKDFDAPAKYHVSANFEYLRYMVAYLLEFEFYKTLCIEAGQYDPADPALPLDNCDIYGSKKAGAAFSKMLSLGGSKPWPDVLEAFNGKRTLTADAIVEYFAPLQKFLEEENKKNNVSIGWGDSDKCVSN